MNKLADLNNSSDAQAVLLLEPLIERAPEIAKKVARQRPFKAASELGLTIRQELLALREPEKIDLFNAHPELAPDNPLAMTSASQSEQGRLNLTSGNNKYRTRLAELNESYRGKFGFPFITALVRHQNMQSVMSEFEARLEKDREAEIEQALEQIVTVSSARVQAGFGGENADPSEGAAVST